MRKSLIVRGAEVIVEMDVTTTENGNLKKVLRIKDLGRFRGLYSIYIKEEEEIV